MILPQQTNPIYTLKVPSTKKEVKYRPFLVKEEKAMRMAHQSEEDIVMLDTIKQVITSCTNNSVDVDSLAIFDIEYIFAQIRAKSIGELSELAFSCGSCTKPNNIYTFELDVTTIEITNTPEHDKRIELFDDVGIVMKYPSLDMIKKIENGFEDTENVMDIIINCVDMIYKADKIFHGKELSKNDIYTFLENLNGKQFEKIKTFFLTMPKFQKLIEFDCPACGAHNKLMLEGLQSFF